MKAHIGVATKSSLMQASVRAKVEQPFRIIKRQFGHTKVRHRGLLKNRAVEDAVRVVEPVDGTLEVDGTGWTSPSDAGEHGMRNDRKAGIQSPIEARIEREGVNPPCSTQQPRNEPLVVAFFRPSSAETAFLTHRPEEGTRS